ncbi:Prolipoprotein diacylglyceryl transferase [BD1-7 clade bacterium]|uniref:Phosphatidylglycerol--prolipoprotein diacylglyceryl transferase n=1 Tax=BD1-7 clade bacterium TaxID=2029982 RepID=A0A5S9MRL1_9GAMM|nr:Prolipoprotein diacylglyceryl transferase [BD1-7 clade bacterium]CAA0080790.1 Prolipoprotein diacylglyceryl transferase [BD1-7 clade bacterium]CAA0084460.1 Prolipoprotein diacylglyceryl transferase [BD1-7 clade bacterium]
MLVHPNMDPVAIDLGFVQIHWYGLMYLAAFAFAYWICRFRAKQGRAPFRPDQVDDIVFFVAMGTIIGGRLGYMLFYNFGTLVADPVSLFRIGSGGMSFHGGLIGVMLGLGYWARREKVAIGDIFDFAALAAPVGMGFGRLGNFIGQELWGRPTDVPWAMVFPRDPSGLARHPSQLYQAFLEGIVLFAVIYWFTSTTRPRWAAAGLFAILYGIFRFLVEFVREPDAHIGFDLWGWMSRGQLLSIPMIMIGILVMMIAYYRNVQPVFVDPTPPKTDKKA